MEQNKNTDKQCIPYLSNAHQVQGLGTLGKLNLNYKGVFNLMGPVMNLEFCSYLKQNNKS